MTGQPERILNVGVAAQLMLLEPGTFCIFHAPVAASSATASGLPGVRITPSPTDPDGAITIRSLDEDGWLGLNRGAALVRVERRPTWILVTTYHDPAHDDVRPNLQVARIYTPMAKTAVAPPFATPATTMPQAAAAKAASEPASGPTSGPGDSGIVAHIQRRGDVQVASDAWMGTIGSKAWIEGFAIVPGGPIAPDQIEYQAVLGQGWFSPWVTGGTYCGSRGMALPLLGLRVRLTGKAAEEFTCHVSASFVDGSRIGPVEDIAVMSDDLSPLEAFLIEIAPRSARGKDAADATLPDADTMQETQMLDLLDDAATQKPAPARMRPARRMARRNVAQGEGAVEPPPSAIASPARTSARKSSASRSKKTATTSLPATTAKPERKPAGKSAKTPSAAKTAPSPLAPEDIHPGRGRKAPGSRVALLKARRKAATRRRD